MESQVQLVQGVGDLTLEAGGKRLRPALVSLSAIVAAPNSDLQRARKLGACMEMIHMATLIHDDVIDHASMRRGMLTAANVYGNSAAILTGDVLLSKAMRLLAIDGDIEIIRLVSGVVVDLAEGEVHEVSLRGKLDVSEEEHREVLRRKTATFLAACCQVGAMSQNADAPVVGALGEFGANIGMAFQFVDDVLDYRGDPEKTGKPRMGDFSEGCATLPLIRMLQTSTESERRWIEGCFGMPLDLSAQDRLLGLLESSGALESAHRSAREQCDLARAVLRSLPKSDERAILEAVTDFILERLQ